MLYAAWCTGLFPIRQRELEDPKLFLRARRELEEEEPVAVRAAEELIRNLYVAGAIARRAMRQWREATHAIASCAVVQPFSRAMVCNASTSARLREKFSPWKRGMRERISPVGAPANA